MRLCGGIRAILMVSLAITAVGAAGADPPRRDFPRVGEYEILCGDFHTHTVHSDGSLTVRQRVENAHDLGYNVIAVTDHGNMRGCWMARRVGEALGMVVVSGFETGNMGIGGGEHWVALGVLPSYQVRDGHNLALTRDGKTAFYQDEMRNITAAGGVLLYAHPNFGVPEGKSSPESVGDVRLSSHLLPAATIWGIEQSCIAGIEVQCGWGDVDWGWGVAKHGDAWCYPFAFDWALEHNLALFADTDVHGRSTKPYQPVTLVFTTSRNADGVMEAIRARRTAAWFNGMVWGREKLLSELVKAVVHTNKTAEGRLVLENRSPIMLKCVLATATDKVVEIGAYKSVVTDWTAEDSLKVRWTNLWTSSKANLESIVTSKSLRRR